ncbi:hypothetical protein SERLA73DRAFT_149142 [Serpula lacrymans var. lacrymans S7.3]|uniref:Uncharacterized protein n=1 Tax=Serpula lacrymans var. lacrymans (strain S7.3) TaxID=936435 RepID=F8PFI1_SERL3|nr:hypothetical protein SERLA73DRAFT_149142 [Serpula lacrymans var. lacrymans S7.3]
MTTILSLYSQSVFPDVDFTISSGLKMATLAAQCSNPSLPKQHISPVTQAELAQPPLHYIVNLTSFVNQNNTVGYTPSLGMGYIYIRVHQEQIYNVLADLDLTVFQLYYCWTLDATSKIYALGPPEAQ